MAGVVFGDLVAGGNSPHSPEWLINLVSLWRSPCIQMQRPLSSALLPRLKENTAFAARYLEGLPGDDACWVWAWVIFKSISAAFGGFMEFLTVVSPKGFRRAWEGWSWEWRAGPGLTVGSSPCFCLSGVVRGLCWVQALLVVTWSGCGVHACLCLLL